MLNEVHVKWGVEIAYVDCFLSISNLVYLFYFNYLFKSDHQWVHNTYNQNIYTHKHTHTIQYVNTEGVYVYGDFYLRTNNNCSLTSCLN